MDKILIVENDPETLKFLTEGLGRNSNNFVTLCASNGEDAIELLKQIKLLYS